MDFSPYVPQQVRDYITGVFKSLPSLSADLSGDLLRRLMSNDPRMRTVWADLSRIAQSDEDYVKFVQAAWLARKDYATWRKRLRQAGELGRQIAGKANELAELLGQIQQTHTRLPSEFSSIQALLWCSPSAQGDVYDSIWRAVRQEICGPAWMNESTDFPDTPAATKMEIDNHPTDEGMSTVRFYYTNEDEEEMWVEMSMEGQTAADRRRLSALFYAWEKAPDVRQCLLTLARVAEAFCPHPGADHIAQATHSRKQNTTLEYIRGFAQLLEEFGLSVNSPMQSIMATTTAVVLDQDVEPEQVRKALDGRFKPDLS